MASMASALVVGLAGLSSGSGALAGEAVGLGSVLAQITIERSTAGSLTITADILAESSTDVTAELRIERGGSSGSATTVQVRDMHLGANSRERVGETTLSFAPTDWLAVSATVRRDGAVISAATVTAGGGTEAGPLSSGSSN